MHYDRFKKTGNPGGAEPTREKHGLSNSPTYSTWEAMKERCYNKRNKRYHRYGGRGITMCDEWKKSYTSFLSDMGEKPKPYRNYSIERINNDGNYEPGNCKWITLSEQTKNQTKRIGISGISGVTKRKRDNRWVARIRIDGVYKFLGAFDSIEDAAKRVNQERLA